MLQRIFLLLLIGLMGLTTLGCDQEARQHAKTQKEITHALDLIDETNLGYVPIAGSASSSSDTKGKLSAKSDPTLSRFADLSVYRQAKLSEAFAVLQPVLQDATATQKRAVLRLLADISASASREQFRQATVTWSILSNDSAVLLSFLIAIERSNARLQSLKMDDEPLLLKLQSDQKTTQQTFDVVQRKAQTIKQEIKQRRSRIVKHKQKIQKAKAKASALKSKAFTATGNQKYDLYNEADVAQRLADKNSADAQIDQVHLNILVSELAIFTEQAAFHKKFRASIIKQIKKTETRQSEIKQQRFEAQTRLKENKQRLVDLLTVLVKRFSEHVDVDFQQTLEQANKSIRFMNKAIAIVGVSSKEKELLDTDLMTLLIGKLGVLQVYALAYKDFGDKLKIIASRTAGSNAVLADRATFYQATFDKFKADQENIIAMVDEVVQAAAGLKVQPTVTGDNSKNKKDAQKNAGKEKATSLYDHVTNYQTAIAELAL